MKSIYDVLKAENHWFATNYIYSKDKFGMEESTYDLCLLYSSGPFGVMGIQTDDTLILIDNNFTGKEESAI